MVVGCGGAILFVIAACYTVHSAQISLANSCRCDSLCTCTACFPDPVLLLRAVRRLGPDALPCGRARYGCAGGIARPESDVQGPGNPTQETDLWGVSSYCSSQSFLLPRPARPYSIPHCYGLEYSVLALFYPLVLLIVVTDQDLFTRTLFCNGMLMKLGVLAYATYLFQYTFIQFSHVAPSWASGRRLQGSS